MGARGTRQALPAAARAPSRTAARPPARGAAAIGNQAMLRNLDEGGFAAPSVVHDVLSSPGRPLEDGVRGRMERGFGRDLRHVRVHTGPAAARSARAVAAEAYTVGHHVVFGEDRYAPQAREGQALLAHELAHVTQDAPGVLARVPVRVRCPANTNNAPADPLAALTNLDRRAGEVSGQLADALQADSVATRGGIPASPSGTFTSYQTHFGLPPAQGSGFLNRLTGHVRPTQHAAAAEELHILSRRFRFCARTFSQNVVYRCPSETARVSVPGCDADTCADAEAWTCEGAGGIVICPGFWVDFDEDAQVAVLIHEALHMSFGDIADETVRGAGRNFLVAECYELIADEFIGAASDAECPAIP